MSILVIDASVVVAALVDSGAGGQWSERQLTNTLAAPHLVMVEVTNILRKAMLKGELSTEAGSAAYADLLALPIELFPFDLVSARVWELRDNLTAYDATYVALAELFEAPLATLDNRLVNATGPRCQFVAPST